MSYLAMSAAPIDNDNDNNTSQYENSINKKRQHHNKTQKFRQSSSDFNPEKVNSVLQSIHNNTPDDDDANLGNYSSKGTAVSANHSDNFKPLQSFNFPDKPVSMGGARKKQEGFTVPQPINDEELKLQELQSAFMNDAQVKEYYNKLVPSHQNYSHQNPSPKNYSLNNFSTNSDSQNDNNQLLIEKLNYMINLLEEQQDQKTGSATEEVVLYSFLGIFIIFVIDSFTKVGKYVR
jgi:hypothetical protein